MAQSHNYAASDHFFEDEIPAKIQRAFVLKKTPQFAPLNRRQKQYVNEILTNDQTFATGVAGTGKTYVPAAVASRMMVEKKIRRIIVTRPNVSAGAGRSLGFFPGSLEEKMAPWSRPVMDVFQELMGDSLFKYHVRAGNIEVAAFEVMRGRTFKDAFVILDEAQNCTYEDLKLFLTRIGTGARVVVCGDTSQDDLGRKSGLKRILELAGTYGIPMGRIHFTSEDVVRSGVCQQWVKAFEGSE